MNCRSLTVLGGVELRELSVWTVTRSSDVERFEIDLAGRRGSHQRCPEAERSERVCNVPPRGRRRSKMPIGGGSCFG